MSPVLAAIATAAGQDSHLLVAAWSTKHHRGRPSPELLRRTTPASEAGDDAVTPTAWLAIATFATAYVIIASERRSTGRRWRAERRGVMVSSERPEVSRDLVLR